MICWEVPRGPPNSLLCFEPERGGKLYMKHTILGALAVGALLVGGITATSQSALADGDGKRTYRVTVANATAGQSLAPGVVITHRRSFSLFEVTGEASPGLAFMAEFGDPGELIGELTGAPGVRSVDPVFGQGVPVPVAVPGEKNSIYITTSGRFLTAVGMLAATNDAFYAVRGVRLPRRGKITVRAIAYDAGAELNNEIASDVQATSGNSDDTTEPGEGFIHIHSGIRGDDDLPKSLTGVTRSLKSPSSVFAVKTMMTMMTTTITTKR
jgi:hypothetical protein